MSDVIRFDGLHYFRFQMPVMTVAEASAMYDLANGVLYHWLIKMIKHMRIVKLDCLNYRPFFSCALPLS